MILNKDCQNLKVKTLALELSDLDPKNRRVSGYFASFNTLDSDSDIIRKGAFTDSILQRGPQSAGNRKIAHLWEHDWSLPIGKLLELHEDDFGLKFVSQLGRSEKANDVFLNYQDGILREHSVGFYYLPDGTELVQDSKIGAYTNITNVELFEGSSVTFGSNSLTPVLDVYKSENITEQLQLLEDEMAKYIDLLRNGEGTDERFYQIEMGLKTLQSKYSELFANKTKTPQQDEVKIVSPEFNALKTIKHYLV